VKPLATTNRTALARRATLRSAARLVAFLLLASSTAAGLHAQNAPGAPGAVPTWTTGSKDGLGTSTTAESKVWYTLQGGIMTEVYYPRLDVANTRTLEFAVSDGKHVWLESKDMHHALERPDENSLVYRQTSTAHLPLTVSEHGNQRVASLVVLVKTYVTDPATNTVLIDVGFRAPAGFKLYVLFDPALKNLGTGDTGYTRDGALVTEKEGVACALISSSGFGKTSTGYKDASDGYTDLLLHQKLDWSYARAESGNVVQAAEVNLPETTGTMHFTLALGFGENAKAAAQAARSSLTQGIAAVIGSYTKGWAEYVATLRHESGPHAAEFRLAAMVLKAHEDKTFPGAMIASMSIPWGFSVKADVPGVGGYHLIWARDLYEVATAMMLAGDRAAAERALNYLFTVQQKPDGSVPQNSWLDGKPYWTALQIDEVSYPLVLAWQLDKTDTDTWTKHVKPAADFVVAHGPATQEERWEEVGGYSPASIAAEIAGLICAADIAKKNGATDDAARYTKTADDWSSHLESWLVTTTGHAGGAAGGGGYYIRIDDNTDPNDGFQLDVKNGGGVWDEREVIDAGFLELVRLGIRPPNDPSIVRSVAVVDATIRTETPNGPSFHRYSHDGYGENFFGGPWITEGIGRIWPIFTGERGEYEIAAGRNPRLYLESMEHFANDGGMIPEQLWDVAQPTQSNFVFGEGTGSATPLAWSMAQFIRLVVDNEEHRIVEQPAIVAEHFGVKK
jgi:glucan 1,4-alpha-glucosidase